MAINGQFFAVTHHHHWRKEDTDEVGSSEHTIFFSTSCCYNNSVERLHLIRLLLLDTEIILHNIQTVKTLI